MDILNALSVVSIVVAALLATQVFLSNPRRGLIASFDARFAPGRSK